MDIDILKTFTLQSAATGTTNGTDMDISGMSTLVLLITTADSYTGTVTFNAAPDSTNFDVIRGNKQGTTTQATSVAVATTAVQIWEFQVSALKKFRASITGDASNHVTIIGYASPIPNFSPIGVTLASAVLAAGTAVIGSVMLQAVSGTALGADVSNTELKVSGYGKNSAAGDTPIKVSSLGEVQTLSGGSQTTAVAAAAAAAAIKASTGALHRVIVTTAGTAALSFYDNASAASGTILLTIPANATAGTIYDVQFPAANGIWCASGTNSPAVTVGWS